MYDESMTGTDIASSELMEKLAMLAPEKADTPSVKTAAAQPPRHQGVLFLKKLGEELEKARRVGEARADEEYTKLLRRQ